MKFEAVAISALAVLSVGSQASTEIRNPQFVLGTACRDQTNSSEMIRKCYQWKRKEMTRTFSARKSSKRASKPTASKGNRSKKAVKSAARKSKQVVKSASSKSKKVVKPTYSDKKGAKSTKTYKEAEAPSTSSIPAPPTKTLTPTPPLPPYAVPDTVESDKQESSAVALFPSVALAFLFALL